MMSSVFPTAMASVTSGVSTSNNANSTSPDNNVRFEDELYVAYLQARAGNIAVSSAGLLEWAQEIAVSEGYYDRDEAKSALTAEWLDGWCQRYNVSDVDGDGGEEAENEEIDDELDEENDNNLPKDDEDELLEGDQTDDAVEASSLVLYPPPIDSPLTPSPPPQHISKKGAASASRKPLPVSQPASGTAGDIESVVANYASTPAPRSRLFEQMLADSASRVLIKFMNETLHMGDDVRPEHLPPDELNRVLIQFFRQLHRPGSEELYSVKVMHGILEGLARYLRGVGFACDLAYESNFSEARTAFGERLSKAFEIESKQRFVANSGGDVDDVDDVDNEQVTKKMQQEHHLRPLGSDEIAPDEAMAGFNKNTQKVMSWAAKNVVAFGRERLGLTQFTRVEEMPPELLNIALTRFFCEARKADGTEFGWNSFKSVFSNLEAYLRVHRYPLGLHDPIFRMAKQTLFNVLRPSVGSGANSAAANAAAAAAANASSSGTAMSSASGRSGANSGANSGSSHMHHQGGAGTASDSSQAVRPLYHRPIEINSTEENTLWQKGAFGWHSPQAINTTLYYYMRHIYGVRSGESHRRISFGDLKTVVDGKEEYLVYTKAAAGVDMSRLRRLWATRNDRCIVKVYKVMVAKRPPETRKPDAPLYLQPKRQRTYVLDNIDGSAADETSTDYWFTTAPLGKNALATLMREAYQACGLDSSRFNTTASSFSPGDSKRFGSDGQSNKYSDGYGDDDLGDDLADDDELESRSSSSFSHGTAQQTLPTAATNVRTSQVSFANGRQQQSFSSATSKRSTFPSSLSPSQSQAMDLASPNNRKRDNFGRFTGTSSGSSPGQHQQQEALSLCTTNKINRNSNVNQPSSVPSRPLGVANNPSFKPKIAKLSNEAPFVKTEPNNKRSSTGLMLAQQQQNSPPSDSASDLSGVTNNNASALASSFGNGVGNMSISMQPKTAADMADVLSFLNQFLNNSANTSNSSLYKCSINVTVNITK